MKEKLQKARDDVKEFAGKAYEQAKAKAIQVGKCVTENKEMVALGVPVAIAAIRSGQSLVVNRRVKKERSRINHTFYDPSTGFHWDLRRKPTNLDRAEFLRRKEAGQSTEDILRAMNLIR